MSAQHLLQALLSSRKYGGLCEQTLLRVARWAVQRAPSRRQALKMAKRKLHQISGAFTSPKDIAWIDQRVDSIASGTLSAAGELIPSGRSPADGDEQLKGEERFRSICSSVLRHHASTRERIPFLTELYAGLFEAAGGYPESILDLACGLNPFSIPWMGILPTTRYVPVDMDCRLVSVVNRFLSIQGREPRAACKDLLSFSSPHEFASLGDADMVLLFKILPSLEQQDKGAAETLLLSLSARTIVVSYPTRSLSGKRRGMENSYARFMESIIRSREVSVARLDFPSEIFFVLRNPGTSGEHGI